MEIKREYTFTTLYDACWSGAINTLDTIAENDKEEEYMNWLEMYFEGRIPTLTEVNDLLWFEDDFIFEQLGINNDEEEEDED